jgi:nitrate/nitrite transporter NarK
MLCQGDDTTVNVNKMQVFWFRCFALLVVTLVITWMIASSDATTTARINSMSPAQLVEYERKLHSHSTFVLFLIYGLFGGLYLGANELIVFVLTKISRGNDL